MKLVRAAGGVVWRRRTDGVVEVLITHRPRYDDWSFPKGKADDGEDDLDTALREVWEETGLRCEAGAELATAGYLDHKGRPKQVRYWLMHALDGELTVNDEVDVLEWVTPADAVARLSYEHDRVLAAALQADPGLLH